MTTVPVPALDEAIAKVLSSSGHVVEAQVPIPSVGWYAAGAEPGGLPFGLIVADPDAGASR